MMEVRNLTVRAGGRSVLQNVSARFRSGCMNAVIGPSGCGKTTLVRAAVGSGALQADGEFWLEGTKLTSRGDRVGRVGYVPQFCLAHPDLTVEESILYSLKLLDMGPEEISRRADQILAETGLSRLRTRFVGKLSGGQLRRVALALELVADPSLLFCDEVTAGLDPESEDGILDLIRTLVERQGKTVVNVIHNLHHLHRFDWIVVLDAGEKVFEGHFPAFQKWFELEDPVKLFRLLGDLSNPRDWAALWREKGEEPAKSVEAERPPSKRNTIPASDFSQAKTLLQRRFRLFLRDRGYLALTAAITIGFPLLVVIFALDGIPQLTRLSMDSGLGTLGRLQGEIAFAKEAADVGSLVSSLILFQVVLLTLTGSNNGAREIAPQAGLFFQESLRGLRPGPFCFEKLVFTGGIAVVQGIVMTVVVKSVVHFPGSWWIQGITLVLVSLALSWLALGFSAWLKSGEKASLLAVYVVGFQLPLSGIVLTLPEPLTDLLRSVITTYWGWASYLASFRNTGLYDAAVFVSGEKVPPYLLCLLVLLIHVFSAMILVASGVFRMHRTR
ncbi:ATP-binding cassette domain-containing protein [Puniceicoccus vermicola]|uniref:ABC transporter ATP-binding protein n=1 Tax=Puniceicoccus vermicola TaxID=388746 RepID=A0A7X1E4F9_9BACT|nr:ABC transporter ATP-binding protein [Puniceicoccus vermicola]MBC2602106.1 ABC transporter ATP-binding protein [Puniceicoccus vermicola]